MRVSGSGCLLLEPGEWVLEGLLLGREGGLLGSFLGLGQNTVVFAVFVLLVVPSGPLWLEMIAI